MGITRHGLVGGRGGVAKPLWIKSTVFSGIQGLAWDSSFLSFCPQVVPLSLCLTVFPTNPASSNPVLSFPQVLPSTSASAGLAPPKPACHLIGEVFSGLSCLASSQELPWWSSPLVLPMQGAQVQSLGRELDPTCHNEEYLLEGLMLKLKLQYSGHLMWKAGSLD